VSVVHCIDSGVDQVVPPSSLKEIRESPATPVESTTAHDPGAKQLTALTPRPPWGAGDTDTERLFGSYVHSESPLDVEPAMRH
jgi:hypothetical protein